METQIDLFSGVPESKPTKQESTIPLLPTATGKAKATHKYTDEHGKTHYWHSYGRKPKWFNDPATKQISKSWRFG